MSKIWRSTMTSKGQITLPKALREHLHLSQGSELEFVIEGNTVTVRQASERDPLQAWFGLALGPDGTAEAYMDQIRERDGDPPLRSNSPEQRIMYLFPDGSLHEDQP